MLLSLDAMVLLEVANACMRICRGNIISISSFSASCLPVSCKLLSPVSCRHMRVSAPPLLVPGMCMELSIITGVFGSRDASMLEVFLKWMSSGFGLLVCSKKWR